MKRSIVTDIEPYENGVRCGECEGPFRTGCECCVETVCKDRMLYAKDGLWYRGPACLGGEIRHKRMVEALRGIVQTFDIAIEQIEAGDRNFEEAIELIADAVLVARRAVLREEE